MDSKNNKFSRRSFLSKSAMGAGAVAAASFSGIGNELKAAVGKTKKYSRPSNLEITGIQVGFTRGGSHMYVKVNTNQGIHGWAEGADSVPDQYHLAHRMGRMITGRNPLDVHRIFEDLRRSGIFRGGQSAIYISVAGTIVNALWDLCGKALNVPLYQLLGGKFRDRFRVYMDTVMYASAEVPTPQDFVDSALRAVNDYGMTAVKMDVDEVNDPHKYDRYNWTASPGELERIYECIAATREAVGPYVDIAVDCHGRYDLTSGKRIARLMEPLNLIWLEEPVPPENEDAYKAINDQTTTPICAGENHYLAYEFRRFFEIGALDIIMPDLQKSGDFGESQRIANLANLYEIPFAPHMVSSYLGAMAACHVSASVPNFLVLEWQQYFHTDQMFQDIIEYDGNQIDDDGFITLSEAPGVGVDINEEALAQYKTDRLPFDFDE